MVRSWLSALPRRAATELLAWVSDNPLRVSGVVMAAVAAARLVGLLAAAFEAAEVGVGPGGDPETVLALASDPTAAAVAAAVATGHPAYVLAVVVGVGGFVAWR